MAIGVAEGSGGEGLSKRPIADMGHIELALGLGGPAMVDEEIQAGAAGGPMVAGIGGDTDVGVQESAEALKQVAAPEAGIGAQLPYVDHQGQDRRGIGWRDTGKVAPVSVWAGLEGG